MSLLRKIRKRHKAFALKRSAQIHGDKAASVFPVNDGEDGDENEDADFQTDSLQQPDEQNGDMSVSASYDPHQMPVSMEHVSVQTDNSAQSSIFIPANSAIDVVQGMQITGKESRFWFRIAKTAAFLLVTVGAFSVGKLAAMGITLTAALACKLFARDRIINRESFIFTETKQSHLSLGSLPSKTDIARLDSEEMVTWNSAAPFVDESNGTVGRLVTIASSTLQARDEEASDLKSSGNTLLAQRRKLRRLNCMKIPTSPSPVFEAMEDSPSSSAKASPRTWFHNAGNSTPTGKGTTASSAEMNKEGKFKSKVLLRHFRRKGEPHSAPSSPLSSSLEASNNLCVASDGSDTERSPHPTAPVHRRSKFRPASPSKKAPIVNGSMGLSNQQTLQTLAARKGERKLLASEVMVTDNRNAVIQKHEMETSGFTPTGRETSSTEVHFLPSQAVEKMKCALMPATPTSRDAAMKVDIHSPRLASTYEPPCQRRVKDQASRRTLKHVSQEGFTAKAVASIKQESLPAVAVQKGGERRGRVGTLWVIAGIVITLAGLFVGRMMAVTGLVCYWYAISLKKRKASERRR